MKSKNHIVQTEDKTHETCSTKCYTVEELLRLGNEKNKMYMVEEINEPDK